MVSAINLALSGLNAASLRTYSSASNIANAQSTSTSNDISQPYMPKDVVQVSGALGGVEAKIIESNKPPLQLFDPGNINADSNGIVKYPNVDLAEELVKSSEALFQYKANLSVIEKDRGMHDAMLDIFV